MPASAPIDLVERCKKIASGWGPIDDADRAALRERLRSYSEQPAHWGSRQLADIGLRLLRLIEDTDAISDPLAIH